ncbi:MAG TPA: acyltransferase [Rhodanobacteraceae bacterium]|nr:acyltransferase [Rhodanobacteraceae bacterium]
MDVTDPESFRSTEATAPLAAAKGKSDSPTAAGTRNSTIDLFRLVAIFGVIIVHTSPVTPKVFGGAADQLVNLMITGAGRLAVPFFFVVSGYFFGRKIHSGSPPLPLFAHYATRLLRIWVLWSLIYLCLPLRLGQWFHQGWGAAVVHQFEHMAAHPLLIIWVGGKGHLWFLMALVMALAIAAVCERLRARAVFYALAVALYLLGLVAGLYANTVVGLHLPFDTRNGPFMSTLLVACGYWAAGHRSRIGPVPALVLAAIGLVGFEAELNWIPLFSSHYPPIIDYGLFTPVFGVGVLLFGLAVPWLGGTWWPRIGAYYVLGIYVCHDLFVEPAWFLHAYFHSYVWEFMFPLIVFFLALGLTALLASERHLRLLVR